MLRYYDQAAAPGHHHRVVHRDGHVHRDALGSRRSAHSEQGGHRADPQEPRDQVRPRQADHTAVPDLHGQHAEGRLRHFVHAAEPQRQRHHRQAFSGVCDARHPRDRIRGDRRHLVGRAHGAVPQPAAGHRDHVSRDPRHLGAELRVRGVRATGTRASERDSGPHAVAGGRVGHRVAHDRAIDRARSRHHGVSDAADAIVDARDRQRGLHPHRQGQGSADHADLSEARTAQRDSAGDHRTRPCDRRDHDRRLRRGAGVRDSRSRAATSCRPYNSSTTP